MACWCDCSKRMFTTGEEDMCGGCISDEAWSAYEEWLAENADEVGELSPLEQVERYWLASSP